MESELKILMDVKKNFLKLQEAYSRCQKENSELKSKLQTIEMEKNTQLKEAASLRLVAEQQAAEARVAAEKLKTELQMYKVGLSPADTGEVLDTPERNKKAKLSLEEEEPEEAQANDKGEKGGASMSLSVAPTQKNHTPLVMLSGYGENNTLRTRLARKIEQLGGTVYIGKDFSDSITHIVSPLATPPTMKIITGFLLHSWIISDEWVMASAKSNTFLPELDFGGVRSDPDWQPLEGKCFLLHNSFMAMMEDKVKLAVQLIALGGGTTVEQGASEKTDFRLISRDHGKTASNDMTWSELLRLIAGPLELKKTPSKKQKPGEKRLRFESDSDI